MPPKRSTRSSTRAGKAEDDSTQQTLEESTGQAEKESNKKNNASNGKTKDVDPEAVKTGDKRGEPSTVTADNADEGKKDGMPATKRQKTEAAKKAHIEGGAEELDAKGEEAKAKGKEIQEDDNVETMKPGRGTLERGTIYFWYKPKVEVEDPEGLDDVSKCHVLLLAHQPKDSKAQGTPYRLLTFGRKHLPEPKDGAGGHEVEWGRVTAVGSDLKELKDALGASTYETKTRGTRHQPASRCAGQGYYIFRSPDSGEEEGDDKVKPLDKADENRSQDFPVYLAYAIAVPEEKDFGDVQHELKIVPKGSFAVQVKNPDAPATNPAAAGASKNAQEYPPELRGLFTTRWIPANPLALLDYTGQELLFLSCRHKESEAVKKDVEEPAEKESAELEEKLHEGSTKTGKKNDEDQAVFEEAFGELDMFQKSEDVPGLRALEGEWA